MKAYIKAIDYYLPEKTVSNEELVAEFPEWTVDKIAAKVGINNRHIAKVNETAGDLAIKAAETLFENHPEINRADIDFVLLCTQSPDYYLPPTSCIIQNALGLSTNCGAFDFNLGCSGYVYGLAIAKGLITANIAHNILLITAETYSKYIHPKDKGNRTIFGDGAAATIISEDGYAEIGNFDLGTDGSGAENLIVKTGGSRYPIPLNDIQYDGNGNPISSDHLFMNGGKIFIFTQKNVPSVVEETLKKNNIADSDVSFYVFHQANSFMLDFLRKKIKISEEKFYMGIESVGNTVSNSIPIALSEAYINGKLKGRVLICGFGVGYSWGGCVLNYK